MERTEAGELTEELRAALEARGDVAFAYLFGSHAKGTADAGSDVDVAVHFGGGGRTAYGRRRDETPDARTRRGRRALELEGELERRVGRTVQVVVLEDAPAGLVQNVLATGRLVHCADPGARKTHFVDHARRYFDLAPARRIFDRYRTRRIEEGAFGGGARDGP